MDWIELGLTIGAGALWFYGAFRIATEKDVERLRAIAATLAVCGLIAALLFIGNGWLRW